MNGDGIGEGRRGSDFVYVCGLERVEVAGQQHEHRVTKREEKRGGG